MIAAALVVTAALSSFVCTRAGDGPSLFWQERSVAMQRSGGAADVDVQAVDDALAWAVAQWTNVACSDIVVSVGAPTDSRVVGFDWAAGSGSPENENLLIFRNTAPLDDVPPDPIDVWVHQLGALAITTVTFESGTGRLLDADIEMNDAGFRFTACDPGECEVEHDLKNTLTHELGHVLGLDHPPVNDPGAADATMFPNAAEGDVDKRDLAGDDVAGLCTLFPTGEPAGNCYPGTTREPPPEVRFTPTCTQTGDLPIALVAVGVLARASLRRRIRRAPP